MMMKTGEEEEGEATALESVRGMSDGESASESNQEIIEIANAFSTSFLLRTTVCTTTTPTPLMYTAPRQRHSFS